MSIFLKLPFHTKPNKYKNANFQVTLGHFKIERKAYGMNACYDNGTVFFIDQDRNLCFIDCNDYATDASKKTKESMMPEIMIVNDLAKVVMVSSRNRRLYAVDASNTVHLLLNEDLEILPRHARTFQNHISAIQPLRKYLVAALLEIEGRLYETSLTLLGPDLVPVYWTSLATDYDAGFLCDQVLHIKVAKHKGIDLIVCFQMSLASALLHVVVHLQKKLYLLETKRVSEAKSARDMVVVGDTGDIFLIGLELLIKFKLSF